MSRVIKVRLVAPADPSAPGDGLLGYVTCTSDDGLVIDGIMLRRTMAGRLRLSFPQRTDRQGNPHPIVRLVDAATRDRFEQQVFSLLGLVQEAAS